MSQASEIILAEEKAQADALFNSIGDGAIATDEFGKITRINPTALKILGYSKQEVLGKWFPKKIIEVNEVDTPISIIDRPIIKAFLTGQPISTKIYYRKKNGEKFPVAISVSPIVLNGRPIGAIEVFRDITLEYEIDRMKSEFISLASHQLRTPLSAIKTYSHMLIEGYMGDVSPPQREALYTIINATNRMNELISTLLNITRIESGNIVITPKLLNINILAEEVVAELQHSAVGKDVKLEFRGSLKPCDIKTDNLITKEILTNLVSNAIKYTPEGGTVTVSLKPQHSQVLLSVADTGLGIPRFAQDQIFTKFFRAQNVVKSETSGTGLGLYLVKGLTDRLNGKIWFESEENVGTTFYLALPRRMAALKPKTKTRPKTAK